MKYCVNCGTKLEKGAKTCSYCGFTVEGADDNSNNNTTNDTTVNTVKNQNVNVQQANGLAIAGFVTSLVSLICCCGGISIVSLILSIVGLIQSKKLNDSGKGMAIAGIILSAIAILFSLILSIIFGLDLIDEIS